MVQHCSVVLNINIMHNLEIEYWSILAFRFYIIYIIESVYCTIFDFVPLPVLLDIFEDCTKLYPWLYC
jgi:hypothetical protein